MTATPAGMSAGHGTRTATTVDEALATVDEHVGPLGHEEVALSSAVGRVLSAPVRSTRPAPPFDQSAMDGYAVRHADLGRSPTVLPVEAEVAARPHATRPVHHPGTATRIFTGGMLPLGADTIIRQELVGAVPVGGSITVRGVVGRGAEVRGEGEEFAAGVEVASPGTVVSPGVLAALSLAGVESVAVARRPVVRVLVTGDEVVPPGARPRLGQVGDANGPLLSATLDLWGADCGEVAYVPDEPGRLRRAVAQAFSKADVVVTTGGVSVGDHDLVPAAVEQAGGRRLLWKVAQRPGGPLYLAQRDGTLLFRLPGNPAAVLVNLHVFVRRALDRMVGLDPSNRWRWGQLSGEPTQPLDRTFWLRARATSDQRAVTVLQRLDHQGSHMLSNLTLSNALARIPPRSDVRPDGVVEWLDLLS